MRKTFRDWYIYLSCKICMFLTLHIKYQRQKRVHRVAYFLGVLDAPIFLKKKFIIVIALTKI